MAGVRLVSGAPISCTAGTGLPLGAAAVACSTIVLQAASSNTGNCYWGDSTVTSTAGITLAPGEKVAITYDLAFGNNTFLNLAAVYVNAETTGYKVKFAYEQVS